MERQALIAEMAKEKQLVKVTELMEKFDVSDMTVRRDLDILQQRGLIKKVYGGAVLAASVTGLNQDVAMTERVGAFVSQKKEIARRAAALIEPEDVIILDAGTTTLELALLLPLYEDVVIVTNSIAIAHALSGKVSSLLLSGGIVRPSTQSTIGPKAKEFFSDLRANKLFLGASSLSLERGLMNSNLYESEIKRTMIAVADQVIVLADSSKFESTSYHVFAPWDSVDTLVCDHLLAVDIVRGLADRGVRVVVGDKPE